MARNLKKIAKEVEQVVEAPVESDKLEVDWSKGTVSTGSTLLDLAISGGRLTDGGIPGGIIVEIFGPSSAGKTSLLSEIMASAQVRGGDIFIADPEARLDEEYVKTYGVSLPHDGKYARPDTVPEMFELIWNWKPEPEKEGAICVFGGDSLAALSTDLELSDGGDKMGMRRPKEFSEWMRKTCRVIANNNWLVVLTNQIRMGQMGAEKTPGGLAIEFYSSVRLRIGPHPQGRYIERTVKDELGKERKKIVGVRSKVVVKKSSVDDPYREAPISIVFGYGVDDVRENLIYLKENDVQWVTKKSGEKVAKKYAWYPCIDKQVQSLDKAVAYIEEKGYQDQLRQRVIEVWHKIEQGFRTERRPKARR